MVCNFVYEDSNNRASSSLGILTNASAMYIVDSDMIVVLETAI